MEKKTIELDGKLYEIKLVEPETTKPKLPTLMEVFNKVKPTWYIGGNEQFENEFDENNKMSFDQLSTKAQCKRIQALIALQNIADMYNQEVDYRGEGYNVFIKYGEFKVSSLLQYFILTPIFKKAEHAQLAIEILRNEKLLNNLNLK